MVLTCIHELMQYGLYLRMAPASAGSLIAPGAPVHSLKTILAKLEKEWVTVQKLEATEHGRQCINMHCRYVQYQEYREILGILSKHRFSLHEEVVATLSAWFPAVAASSNVEQLFGELSYAVRKAGKQDCGSLANLMAVAIRGLQRRLCVGENAPTPVQLAEEDWAGREVQALKGKIWSPSSAVPSLFTKT